MAGTNRNEVERLINLYNEDQKKFILWGIMEVIAEDFGMRTRIDALRLLKDYNYVMEEGK